MSTLISSLPSVSYGIKAWCCSGATDWDIGVPACCSVCSFSVNAGSGGLHNVMRYLGHGFIGFEYSPTGQIILNR